MREYLVDKLLEEFEKDKDAIKKNLIKSMNNIILETSNGYEKITLNIKIEKEEEKQE